MSRAKPRGFKGHVSHRPSYLSIGGKKVDVGNRAGKPPMTPPHQVVQRQKRFGSALIRGF